VNRPLIVGIAGAIIVLAAIVLTFFIDRKPDRPMQKSSTGTAEQRAVPSGSSSASRILPGNTATTGSRPAAHRKSPPAVQGSRGGGNVLPQAAGSQPGSQLGPTKKPSFDIVRVNPQGDTVIAGRAAPNTEIIVMQGDKIIDRARADKRGEWVLVPQSPISAGTHKLTAVAKLADGTEISSDQSVVVVVPERGKDVAGKATPRPSGSLAVAIPKTVGQAPVVLQSPGGLGNAGLSLDAIDYGRRGDNLGLSGRAPAGAEVRIYLDNRLIGRATADDKGIWRLNPEIQIPAGLYRMRVDRIDGAGKVAERVELPFSRAAPFNDLAEGTVVFVQPGNSLWRLARRTYGQGLRYTEIYEANKDQIRDPHLIYPGQAFVLPKLN